MIWYKDKNDGIVISTRIRLARNIAGIPFPNALNDKTKVTQEIRAAIKNSEIAKDFDTILERCKYLWHSLM